MAGREKLERVQRRKEELIEELAVARETMVHSKRVLKQNLNVKEQIAQRVNFDQAKVLIGSAAATFIVGKLFNRKKKKEDNEKKSLTKWVKGLIYGVAVKKARGVILDTVKTSLNQRIEKKNNDY